jgi:plastocyanin domain-containing protein
MRQRLSPDDRVTSGAPLLEAAPARYEITLDSSGFHPGLLTVRQGSPVTLVVTRETDQTCAREVVIPALDIRQELALDQPVEFVLTADRKGDLRFACGMNMLTGVIRVE